MDPNQALYDLLVACVELDRDAAREAVEALAVWISRGGALPEVERNFVADSFHVPPTTAPLN